jgi:hypothetical protein
MDGGGRGWPDWDICPLFLIMRAHRCRGQTPTPDKWSRVYQGIGVYFSNIKIHLISVKKN